MYLKYVVLTAEIRTFTHTNNCSHTSNYRDLRLENIEVKAFQQQANIVHYSHSNIWMVVPLRHSGRPCV